MENKQTSIFDSSNHQETQDLGIGNSAGVQLVQMKNSGNMYAIKTFKVDYELEFELECQALQSLVHQNIIRLYEVNQSPMQIALEYCELSDLLSFRSNVNTFSELDAKYFSLQLLVGLKYIHDSQFAHRDIKLENLLVSSSDLTLKIADFGHSIRVENGQTFNGACGSSGYQAPELVREQAYDAKKVDIYAAGVTIFGLVLGKLPFEIEDNPMYPQMQKTFNSDQNKFMKDFHSDRTSSTEFMDLMSKMLCENPSHRLSADEVIAHPWFSTE